MRKYLLVAAFLMFVVDPAIATDSSDNYSVQGVGAQSCGKYIDARRRDEFEEVLFLTWLTGYITAINKQYPKTYSIIGQTDSDGLLLWLENYCQQHPTEKFAGGASKLMNHLYPKRIENAP